jgi:hypothetical protein
MVSDFKKNDVLFYLNPLRAVNEGKSRNGHLVIVKRLANGLRW